MASQYYSLVADGDNVCSFTFGAVGTHLFYQDISGNPTTFQSEHLPLTTRQTARLACIFCCIGFIGSWAGNASLGFTTVASSTIISSIGGTYVKNSLLQLSYLICTRLSILHTDYWSDISSGKTGTSQSRCSDYEVSDHLANQWQGFSSHH